MAKSYAIFAALMFGLVFGISPLMWAMRHWHCWWVPSLCAGY